MAQNQHRTVEEYWTGVASQLQIEADVFNRLVGHNGETGRANEIALSQLAARLLPSSVGVGTGVIIDSLGGRSSQMDLVVFDRATQPQILAQSTQLLFPVETVRAAIEVKTTVTATEIEDVSSKVASLHALVPSAGHKRPLTALFGYNVSGAPASRALEIMALSDGRRPDLTCVLNPGIVTAPEEPAAVGLVPLHAQDANGARLPTTWISDTGRENHIVRGSHTYPISRFAPSARQRYVFEPGRALLIFTKLLLDGLAARTALDGAWLDNYLPRLAMEVVIPQA